MNERKKEGRQAERKEGRKNIRKKGRKNIRKKVRKEVGPEEVVFDFSDAHYVVRKEVCYVVEEGRP